MDPEQPDVGEPKCYKFKLNGFPFAVGTTKESSTAVRRMATNMLFNLYNVGWKVILIKYFLLISIILYGQFIFYFL